MASPRARASLDALFGLVLPRASPPLRLAALASFALISAASPSRAADPCADKALAVEAVHSGEEYQAAALSFTLARLGREPEARALLDRGAAIDAKDREGATALSRAAQAGKTALATLLIDRGAKLNARAVDGSTPLLYAAEADRAAVIRLLIDRERIPTFLAARAYAHSPPPPTTVRRQASSFCSSTARIRMLSTTTARAHRSMPQAAPMLGSSSA